MFIAHGTRKHPKAPEGRRYRPATGALCLNHGLNGEHGCGVGFPNPSGGGPYDSDRPDPKPQRGGIGALCLNHGLNGEHG